MFDGIFTHVDENIWPQVREGGGSLSILLLTGKPHFRCGSQTAGNEGGLWEMDLNTIQDTNLQNKMKLLYSPSEGFCESNSPNWPADKVYQTLAQLMINARDSHSVFSQYFSNIKTEAMEQENNSIYQVVKKVIEINP